MQSRNELGEIISSQQYLNQDELQKRLFEDTRNAESIGAVSHVIGKIPNKDAFVEINGLKYQVKFVDHKKGELRLRLVV